MAEKWVISATGWNDDDESSHGVNGVFDTLEEAWEASRVSAFEDLRDAQTEEIDNWEEDERPVPFVSCIKVVESAGLEEARQRFEGTHKDSYMGHKSRQVLTHTMLEFDIASGAYVQWVGRFYVNRVDFGGMESVL